MNRWWTGGLLLVLLTSCEWSYDRANDPQQPPPPAPPPQTETTEELVPEESGQTPSLPLELEVEELRLVVRTLAEENRRLKEQLRELNSQPDDLSPEPTPTPVPAVTESPVQEIPPPQGAFVLYVNPNWHYLVINQGSEDGFRVSDRVEIQRQQAPIGIAVITEVKPGQAVADIDLESLGSAGLYPRERDRVVRP
jgi:hypothetical protein